MPKKSKLGPTRHDKWYHLAKEQGFRSRAAFKLIQLNKKYEFLGSSRALLDLCAAPGGWLQVAAKFMPVGSKIIGVDLLPIKAIPGVVTFQEDITTPKCRSLIKKECGQVKIDTVLHDGAPNVGGNSWSKDAYGQVELVLHSLKLAIELLRPGGVFITKVFRSQDYNSLLWVCKQFFKKTEVTKPVASRNSSAEIYFICQGFLAPKSIDPRLLDPQHVFGQLNEDKKSVDVFNKKEGKRHREGYDDDVTLLYKEVPVAQFVESDDPIDMLGTHSKLVFDEDSALYAEHQDTTAEIKELCCDLKVLGKPDFKALLRWRTKMRQYRKQLLEEEEGDDGSEDEAEAEPSKEEIEEKQDEKLQKQLESMQAKVESKKKREKKKRREMLSKERQRAAMNMTTPDLDNADETGLFSLNTIPDAKTIEDVEGNEEDAPLPADFPEYGTVGHDDDEAAQDDEDGDDQSEGSDADEAYKSKLEEDLDAMYLMYRERRKIISSKEAKKGRAVGVDGEVNEDETLEKLAEKVFHKEGGASDADASSSDDDDDASDPENNPLVVRLGARDTPKDKAARWFSRDVFGFLGDTNGEATNGVAGKKRKATRNLSDDEDESDVDDADAGHGGDDDGADMDFETFDDKSQTKKDKITKKSSEKAATNGASNGAHGKNNATKMDIDEDSNSSDDDEKPKAADANGFEEVAVEDLSDDSDARAEVLALGTLLLRKDKREALENSGYHRYAFNDMDGLPEWFAEEESKHMQKQLPITKDEVEMFKLQLKALNARPIKKIAEAKGRKKMKQLKQWEKLKNQANSIAEQDGVSAQEKLRSIQKLYGKERRKKKEKVDRTYVVAKKGGGRAQAEARRNVTGPVKIVDRRMKKDKRGLKKAMKGRKKARRA